MKLVLLFVVFALIVAVAFAEPACNVVPCSSYCQQTGHFGGYCIENDTVCHCYDVGHGGDGN